MGFLLVTFLLFVDTLRGTFKVPIRKISLTPPQSNLKR